MSPRGPAGPARGTGGAARGRQGSRGRLIISFATRLLFAAYFIEAGLILIVVPWSAFWEHNFFAAAYPALDLLFGSAYARGAISGLGLVTLLAGLAELGGAFAARRAPPTHAGPTVTER